MGEIAEAMLDGTMCCQCGEGRLPRPKPRPTVQREPRADLVECPKCGKIVKKVGLAHHDLDKHPRETLL
jgi:hypothetical protein